jgi:hypothetical protein
VSCRRGFGAGARSLAFVICSFTFFLFLRGLLSWCVLPFIFNVASSLSFPKFLSFSRYIYSLTNTCARHGLCTFLVASYTRRRHLIRSLKSAQPHEVIRTPSPAMRTKQLARSSCDALYHDPERWVDINLLYSSAISRGYANPITRHSC